MGAGLVTGRGFLAELDTPKHIRKKPNPLRSVSSMLIVFIPFLLRHVSVYREWKSPAC